jgi:Ras-related protein Rab-5C
MHLETSAKNANNVKELFVEIARKLPNNKVQQKEEGGFIINLPKQKKMKGCC